MNARSIPQAARPEIVPFGKGQDEAVLDELAKLSALDYERQREAKAKYLNVRVSMLDKLVSALRPKQPDDDLPNPFEAVDPWPELVGGAALLEDLTTAIRRFCILPEHTDVLMAAWALHAWTHDAADISPILAFVSPEKRCGKSTALSVMSALTPRAMHNVNVSTAVLFRVVEKHRPTVMIDEADTYLADNDELRGILNGGHNRLSAYVWRSVGDDHEPKQFRVWSPKCIAMIGKLPDTLEDRALVVPLRRKQKGETVERFRADRLAEFLPLRRRCQRWADDTLDRLKAMDPAVPDALNDRAQDNARAVCAIADAAGGGWPDIIRGALVGLASQVDDEPQSAGVLLLRDVAEVLETRRTERLGSTELCEALGALEEAPWAEWRRGSPITPRGVARLLKAFGITPQRDKAGRFYRLIDFADPLERYLSDTPEIGDTSDTSDASHSSGIKKYNGINAMSLGAACVACGEGDECKCHQTPLSDSYGQNANWEVEL